MRINDYPIGTIVYFKEYIPRYGIVIDEKSWNIEVNKKNPNMVGEFLSEKGYGNGAVPIFVFGEGPDHIPFNFLRSGLAHNVLSGGLEEFSQILKNKDIESDIAEYYKAVKKDLIFLKQYLNGKNKIYRLGNSNHNYIKWMNFYEEALPGLAGYSKK